MLLDFLLHDWQVVLNDKPGVGEISDVRNVNECLSFDVNDSDHVIKSFLSLCDVVLYLNAPFNHIVDLDIFKGLDKLLDLSSGLS